MGRTRVHPGGFSVLDKIKLTAAVAFAVGGVALFYLLQDESLLLRVGAVVVAVLLGAATALTSSQGRAALEFARGADIERRKVVWPGNRETMQVTLWVIFLVVVVGLYLWILDSVSFWIVYDLLIGVDGGARWPLVTGEAEGDGDDRGG